MKHLIWLIAAAMLIAGCGGGNTGSTSTGTVRGTISSLPAAQTRGTETLTIRVEGTDIYTTVEPGKSFVLTGIPEGLHSLIIENDKYGKAIVIQIGSRLTTEIGEIAVEDAGKITGTVTDADTNSPVSGAVITLTEAIPTADATTNVMPHPIRVKKTGADGVYNFRGLLPGSYIVNIAARGYISSTLMVDVTAQTVATASIALKKDTVTGADAGLLKGTVTLESDGKLTPLAGALVRLRPVLENAVDDEYDQPLPAMLYQVTNGENRPVKLDAVDGTIKSLPDCPRELIAYTDENGNYLIENIPAGNYYAKAVSPGMKIKGAKAAVTITANSTTVQNFTLTLKPVNNIVITGTVTDSVTLKPIANAGVRCIMGVPVPVIAPAMKRANGPLLGANGPETYEMKAASGEGLVITPNTTGNVIIGGSMVIYALTDENGKYKVVSPAVSGIAVSAIGYTPQEKAVTTDASPQIIDFSLAPLQAATITGVVKDTQGNGIAEATIFADYPIFYSDNSGTNNPAITTLALPESRMTKSDANGHFIINTLPGSIPLYIKKEGYQTAYITVNAIANAETNVEVILKALKYGKVTGVVKDSVTNQPISGAVVHHGGICFVMDASGTAPVNIPNSSISPVLTAPGSVVTDAEGKYEFENLPIGEVILTCVSDGYEISYKTVTVKDLLPSTADFAMVPLPKPAIVYGVVTGPDDKPVVGALVSAADLYYIATANTASRVFMPPAQNWVVKTDENGKYRLSLPAWVKEISVVARGYKNSITPVTLQAGGENELNIKLVANLLL